MASSAYAISSSQRGDVRRADLWALDMLKVKVMMLGSRPVLQ